MSVMRITLSVASRGAIRFLDLNMEHHQRRSLGHTSVPTIFNVITDTTGGNARLIMICSHRAI
jgi:hypothetical protein